MTESLKQDEAHVCERCGHINTGETPQLTGDVRKEYLRRILARQPFEHTYGLYDGQLEVAFRTLSVREARPMNAVLRAVPDKDPEHNLTRIRMKLLFQVTRIGPTHYEAVEIPEGTQDIISAAEELYYERFGDMDELLLAAVVESFLMFGELTRTLERSGFDQSFYKGAGLTWSPAPLSTNN